MADTSRVSYHFGSFELLVGRHQLLRDGEAVPLGQRALDVLTALVERAGELVTKEELLEIAWPGLVVEENNLQVQVSSLRKILGNEAIATSAGRGYRFVLEVARRNATQAAATRKIDLIAVLPLENLNRLPSEEYFADGMTESLITSISKVSGLKVIARNSVMRFKGTGESLAGIGRVLGAGAIVEGSVLHSGGRLRISVRLVRVDTEECLWAEQYDRDLADVLALHDQVARAIARAIDYTLHPRPTGAARRVDDEIYLLDLRGRHARHQRTEAGFRAALKFFEETVARDPDYVPGYVGIAEALNMLANFGFVPPQQIRGRSQAAALRALELDETCAEAHRELAFTEWQFSFAWAKAIAGYERALELSPHSPSVTYWFGGALAVMGLFERAHRLLRRAQELDPLSLVLPSVQGLAHIYERKLDQSLPFFADVLRIDPDFHTALWYQGQALVELGRYEEGLRSLGRAYELGGRSSRMLGYLGYASARAGLSERARECLDELKARADQGQYVPPYFLALVHSGLHEQGAALDLLEEAYARRDTMLRDLKVDTPWDELRGLPRFTSLMEKLAYPNAAVAP